MSFKSVELINPSNYNYPARLSHRFNLLSCLYYIGNIEIIQLTLTALFCSFKCPGDAILKAYDITLDLGNKGTPLISGFHTPVEKDMLDILLKGRGPIVICPPRGLEGMRIPVKFRKPLTEGRLLLLSPFAPNLNRPKAKITEERNLFVGALAERILIIHAEPNGRLEKTCQKFFEWKKPVYVLESANNQSLIDAGAMPIENGLLFDR
jgi:predicted Rossmann fold nucleotide-binding protein DprA/Smf involved in DNA uptake